MANPVDTGTFDAWLTDRLPFTTVKGESGSTGDFDLWITDRLPFDVYVEAAAGLSIPVAMASYRRRRIA